MVRYVQRELKVFKKAHQLLGPLGECSPRLSVEKPAAVQRILELQHSRGI